jgi:hypothetical protein
MTIWRESLCEMDGGWTNTAPKTQRPEADSVHNVWANRRVFFAHSCFVFWKGSPAQVLFKSFNPDLSNYTDPHLHQTTANFTFANQPQLEQNNMSKNEKGYMDSATDAVSSAAASVGNAAGNMKDRMGHMGNAISEKAQEQTYATSKEANKEIAKDSHVGVGDRIHAAGSAVSDAAHEKTHEAKYEKEKHQAKN